MKYMKNSIDIQFDIKRLLHFTHFIYDHKETICIMYLFKKKEIRKKGDAIPFTYVRLPYEMSHNVLYLYTYLY